MDLRRFFRPPPRPAPVEGYHAFTTKYDRIVEAAEIDSVLGPLSDEARHAVNAAYDAFEIGFDGLKTQLSFDAMNFAGLLRDALPEAERKNLLVTLLIDHSGSMRGQKMLMAAMTADILQNALSSISVHTEILGFTTVSWKGGESRKLWKWHGSPPNPGRLCDLLHVIHRKATGHTPGTGGWYLRAMMRPDLPKENIDGEALAWAASRLRAAPYTRKVLLVISDGASVDDSTLTNNPADYLERHLLDVIASIEGAGDITLGAIGVGYNVSRYYPRSANVMLPQDMPGAAFGLLQSILAKPDGIPFRLKQIDHVVLRIRDLEASLGFYRDVLGCTVDKVQDKIGLWQVRAGSSLIDLVPLAGALGSLGGAGPAKEGRNVDHFAIQIVPFDEDAIRAHLAAHAVAITDSGQRYGAQGEGPSIYVLDPDGNSVELKGPPLRQKRNASPA